MKCIKCGENNIIKANFCKKCGYEFSDIEKKKARRKTLVGKLELIEKGYGLCKLKPITDNIIFKIVSLIILIVLGISFTIKNGNDIQILKSDMYKVEYNTVSEEYYLLSNSDSVSLNLYVPNDIDEIGVKHMDKDGDIISNDKYKIGDNIILESNFRNDYYKIYGKESEIKLFIYRTEK